MVNYNLREANKATNVMASLGSFVSCTCPKFVVNLYKIMYGDISSRAYYRRRCLMHPP